VNSGAVTPGFKAAKMGEHAKMPAARMTNRFMTRVPREGKS
jgi:hypothetical protein